MKTQYDGSCKLCGALWKVGDDIFLQKADPAEGLTRAVCSDEECYKTQGGKPFVAKKPAEGSSMSTGQSTLNKTENKISQAGAMDDMLYNLALKRLKSLEGSIGEIAVPDKLIFIESWARTVAMSLPR
jgi:hypothetical protein